MLKHMIFIIALMIQSQGFGIAQPGLLMFQIQQGESERALKLYQESYTATGVHDFELLHQIGLALLDYGYRQKDPESQLFALFGASVSAHEDAYYILEECTKSRFEPIQLIALQALAKFQTEKADLLLMHALGSPSLAVRYEAVKLLCKKKHLQATAQAASLLYKSKKMFWPIYPPLFAMIGDEQSTRILRKLLTDPSDKVHLSAILSIAKYGRDDLIPQIRQLSSQSNYVQQEACAFTLGQLKDEDSIPLLQRIAHSSHATTALAADIALYQLGNAPSIKEIEKKAEQGNLFAIRALGEFPEHHQVLLSLLTRPDLQVRYNVIVSLLRQHHPKGLELISELIVKDRRDLAFTVQTSPGMTMKAIKGTSSSSQILKKDIGAFVENLEFKQMLLEEISLQSEESLIAIADRIFQRQQNELVPLTTHLLEELGTDRAIRCLKNHQQQLGAPLIRNYCNLALYHLKEPGVYGEQLAQWVKQQSQTQLIQLKPGDPWDLDREYYTLTEAETSHLLIEAVQAFADNQDSLGIDALIEAIASGNPKNRYALAGLLLRATL
jgi:HEAT repeat protein